MHRVPAKVQETAACQAREARGAQWHRDTERVHLPEVAPTIVEPCATAHRSIADVRDLRAARAITPKAKPSGIL